MKLKLTEAVDIIEEFQEINLRGIYEVLMRVEIPELSQKKYYAFQSYFRNIESAINEKRENSFDNRMEVIKKLKRFY